MKQHFYMIGAIHNRPFKIDPMDYKELDDFELICEELRKCYWEQLRWDLR